MEFVNFVSFPPSGTDWNALICKSSSLSPLHPCKIYFKFIFLKKKLAWGHTRHGLFCGSPINMDRLPKGRVLVSLTQLKTVLFWTALD